MGGNISVTSHVIGEHNDWPETRILSHGAFLLRIKLRFDQTKPRPLPTLSTQIETNTHT